MVHHQWDLGGSRGLHRAPEDLLLRPALVRDVPVEPDLDADDEVAVVGRALDALADSDGVQVVALAPRPKVLSGAAGAGEAVAGDVHKGEHAGAAPLGHVVPQSGQGHAAGAAPVHC